MAEKFQEWTVVGRVRATRKGERTAVGRRGTKLGCKGTDGRKWYVIEKKGIGEWRCSCPAWTTKNGWMMKVHGHCKHLRKFWLEGKALVMERRQPQLFERGTTERQLKTNDIVVTVPASL